MRSTSILTAQDIASYKPSPATFYALEAQIERLGVRKDKLLHVALLRPGPGQAARATDRVDQPLSRQPRLGSNTPNRPLANKLDWTFTPMAGFADVVENSC